MNLIHIKTFALIVFSCMLSWGAASYTESQNIAHLVAYHDSGTYQKELTKVLYHARDFILKRANHHQQKSLSPKLAVILDIDETSLSNYDKMAARKFIGDKKQLHQEILQSDAPPIKPTLALYREALQHGVKIFFVTGRKPSEREATIANLKNAGYKDWTGLYLRPKGYKRSSIASFKSQTRATIAQKGYVIIASIGDQHSDLEGGYAEKTFKLPNPYYYLP